MIRIEKPDYHRECNCCGNAEGVREIYFSLNRYQSTSVALCVDCINVLLMLLEPYKGEWKG